jgi:hypothetical protein
MTTKKKPAEKNDTCIFSLLKKNENILTQADILLIHSFDLINGLDVMNSPISFDSISFVINLLKSKLKNEKNLQIDPLFCLSYSLLYLFNKSMITTTSSKVLFSYAGIYTELLQNEKSCYVIIKHFELQNRLEKSINCIIQSSVWIENEFKEAYKNITNIHEGIKDLISLTFHSLSLIKLIKDENQMNFFILFLNNLISLPEEIEYIEKSYNYIDSHKQEIKSYISQMHFNNLVKILCRMSESLLKKQTTYNKKNKSLSLLIFSNKINILLNDFLFTSKYSNKETTFLFLTNEINELLRLLISKNLTNLFQDEPSFLSKSLLLNLFDNITSGLEKLLLNSFEYLTIIGKIYNFLYNFNANNIVLDQNLMQFYSNKILNFYREKHIIINETLMIKVLIFKEYLAKNKLKVEDNCISDKIGEHIDELNILIIKVRLSSDSDLDFFSVILQYIVKCFDNLVIVLVNNLEKFYNLWTLTEKIEVLCEHLLTEKKEILEKKNNYKDIIKFVSYIKIFNLSENKEKSKISQLLKTMSLNLLNDCSDIKNRTNIAIIYFIKCYEVDNIINLLTHFSKINYEVYSYCFTSTLSSLDKFKVKLISETNSDDFLDKIMLVVNLFIAITQENSSFINEKLIQTFSKLEKIYIYSFKLLLQKLKTRGLDLGSQDNKIFAYLSWTFKISEKINLTWEKLECNLGCIVFLELIEFILYLQDEEQKLCLLLRLYKSFVSNILKEVIFFNNEKNHLLLELIFTNILIQNTVLDLKQEENKDCTTSISERTSSFLIGVFNMRKNLVVEKSKIKISQIIETIINQSEQELNYEYINDNNFLFKVQSDTNNKFLKVYYTELLHNQLACKYFSKYEDETLNFYGIYFFYSRK